MLEMVCVQGTPWQSNGQDVSLLHVHCCGLDSIPGWETKIPKATTCGQNKLNK